MRSTYGKLDAGHLVNNMHDVGSIWKVLHHILTSMVDPIPYVATDGELGEFFAKAIKHNR